MRNQCAAGISLITTLAAGIGLMACQFVAGITDEEPNSTSSSTVASASTSASSSASGEPVCPDPDGMNSTLNCAGACAMYCSDYLAQCPSVSYTGDPECCSTCTVIQALMASGTNGNNVACRQTALNKMDAESCSKAGPFTSPTTMSGGCGLQVTDFDSQFVLVCKGSTLPANPNVTLNGKTLLLASQALYWGCEAAAACLCADISNNMPGNDINCTDKCIKACEAL